MSRRQPKSFLIQQFFKNAGEVWASSPHLRSKSDFQIKLQQKSRRKSKESQLPFQSRGCNENTRFQGQLRFPGKLGMCPSLAEPDSGGFPRSNLSNFQNVSRKTLHQTKKFFDPTIFQKCWRGSGRAALIAARRQRNPRAILLAHGGGGEKSDSFSRRGEQDRPALLPESNQQTSCNCSSGTVATDVLLFHVKHCSWGNQLRTVRQNRFAVCLCAVRRWLCCSNWL